MSQQQREQIRTDAAARSDLGSVRTLPARLERSHSLPFGALSPDEFEVYCYLLLRAENAAETRDLYYLGKTRDGGRDIVRVLQDGSIELIQCKRCASGVGIGEVRRELAKLCVNVHSGTIAQPMRVMFYVSTDLTAPALDLLTSADGWASVAESELETYLGETPPGDLVEFARSWRPQYGVCNGVDLTQRSRPFDFLIEEFFAVRKVIDNAEAQALRQELAQFKESIQDSIGFRFAPDQMALLLARLEKANPGFSFEARSTTSGTAFHIHSSERIEVRAPRFPDTDAGKRGAEKFRVFLDEGRPIVLTEGEFDWEGPVRGTEFAVPPGAERTLEMHHRIPAHSVAVQLCWRDKGGRQIISIPLTYLKLVRFGRREGELTLQGGRFAARLSLVFRTDQVDGHSLVFSLDLPSVRAEDAAATLDMLLAFQHDGTLEISDANNGSPLFETGGLTGDRSRLNHLKGARELLGWFTSINKELGTNLRYPPDRVDHDHANVAEILATAIAHGGRVTTPPPKTTSIALTRDLASQALANWRQQPTTIDFSRSTPFELFGATVPVDRTLGAVRMYMIETMPIEPLDDLARRIAQVDDSAAIEVPVHCNGVAYEFQRWQTP